MEEKIVIDYLNRRNELQVDTKISKLTKAKDIVKRDFSLYHIQELTFEEKSPRKEAFENVLSSLRIDGITFFYLLLGDESGVHFYFGIAEDKSYNKDLILDVDEVGNNILKASIEGNFRGSKVEEIIDQKDAILSKMSDMRSFAKMYGVPTVNEDSEDFQGVDRLVDIMAGDEFGLLILADPLSLNKIEEIETRLYEVYNKLTPLSKTSIQTSNSKAKSSSKSVGKNSSTTNGSSSGKSETITTGENKNYSKGTNQGTSTNSSSSGTSKGGNETRSEGTNKSTAEGTNSGKSHSDTTGESVNESDSISETEGSSKTNEFSNKSIQEWLNYIDEVLLKRVNYGRSKGVFYTNIYLLAKNKGTNIKLGNTIMSLFSGVEGNKVPLDLKFIDNDNEIDSLLKFQFPEGQMEIPANEADARLLLSQSIDRDGKSRFGSWLSTSELSVIAGLPQKEVVGLALKEEVEFGLNINSPKEDNDRLHLGNLVRSGNILQNISVDIDRNNLDKHTFISGVTGSGKTTTCHRILESAEMPFMVIEPAKTEYRILTKLEKDILIFTLGNDNVAPFRLNPLEFFPHENITSRVDMIKASIEAAFDMEAAIPQIIEAALYRAYENYGWNIKTNKNSYYSNPFADGVHSFPTLEDLVASSEIIVDEQGFDERLQRDYIGSIKARLQGLLVGSKGMMLNTPRSVDFQELAKKNVILELEEIRNGSEKSLVMGFVLTNLNEAIRANYEDYKKIGSEYKHITLIEEAHRLLTKFSPGDNPSRKQGVEVFADMLAEVRKYGEALIIVDQIPNKLTSEVLKNTNTKIVHKLFAKDDKDAVGNTMALEDEQKDFLSYLEPGRAIVSTQGFNKPIQVQIKQLEGFSTTKSDIVNCNELRKIALEYYCKNYKKGLFYGIDLYSSEPSVEELEKYISFMTNDTVVDSWKIFWSESNVAMSNTLRADIKNVIDNGSKNELRKYIVSKIYKKMVNPGYMERVTNIERLLDCIERGLDIEMKKNQILKIK